MLDTLIKLGELNSAGKDKWQLKRHFPTNKTKYIHLVFDVENQRIVLEDEGIFDESKAVRFRCLKPKGGNNKQGLVTVEADKHLANLQKSFFGSGDAVCGDFITAIRKSCPEVENKDLGKALLKIFEMKAIFANFQDTEGKLKNKDYILVAAISWSAIENGTQKPLAQLAGFEDYADADIFKQEKEDTTTTATKSVVSKYCYASGEQTDDVKAINFETRYNLNKMFVTTTKNYLSNYQESFSVGNYQASAKNQSYLDVGSKFVLDKLNITIAGITHCILPHVFSEDDMSEELLDSSIKPLVEFLFDSETIDKTVFQHLSYNKLFWITFLGYESDGNSFKTINIIQDVNGEYIKELVETFEDEDGRFSKIPNIPWQRVNTFFNKDKERSVSPFTFKTMYGCIPVRKDKEKKNVALSFFKAILERRMIDPNQVFDFFRDLVLCHRFERYPSYKNIAPNSDFDFALEKAVFHYLAIIQIIKNLKLFKNNYMEQQETTSPLVTDTKSKKYQMQIDNFFEKTGYSDSQKALFYLGRALDQIAYEQVKKKHSSKPILNKINYNGMDLAGVMSLHKELREKIVQYKAFDVEFNLAKFNTLINANQWNMGKSEAMFYIFSGYSFKLESEANKTDNN